MINIYIQTYKYHDICANSYIYLPHEQKRNFGDIWAYKSATCAQTGISISDTNKSDFCAYKRVYIAGYNHIYFPHDKNTFQGFPGRGGGRRAGTEAIFGPIREPTLPARTLSISDTNRSDICQYQCATCSATTQSIS